MPSQALVGIDWEVSFVDDKKDHTLKIVWQISLCDGRGRGIRPVNRRGLAEARVEGILPSSAPGIEIIGAVWNDITSSTVTYRGR
ncbi:hypothetical protein DXT94_32075 [Rhizobium sp. ICMP 5592]|nr:hypothetical protein [Rhizobium sp. ICMP 5592]